MRRGLAIYRNVFSRRLNCSTSISGCRNDVGKLFHIFGPSTGKRKNSCLRVECMFAGQRVHWCPRSEAGRGQKQSPITYKICVIDAIITNSVARSPGLRVATYAPITRKYFRLFVCMPAGRF